MVVVIVTNQRRGRSSWRFVCACHWELQPTGQSEACREGQRLSKGQVTKEEKDMKTANQQEVVRPAPLEAPAANQQRPSTILLMLQIKREVTRPAALCEVTTPAQALGRGAAFSFRSTSTRKKKSGWRHANTDDSGWGRSIEGQRVGVADLSSHTQPA